MGSTQENSFGSGVGARKVVLLLGGIAPESVVMNKTSEYGTNPAEERDPHSSSCIRELGPEGSSRSITSGNSRSPELITQLRANPWAPTKDHPSLAFDKAMKRSEER